jgi:hypothetical protein
MTKLKKGKIKHVQANKIGKSVPTYVQEISYIMEFSIPE